MSTLEALAFNVLASAVVGITALVGFEVAVLLKRNAHLAPRTAARPTSIIQNVLDYPNDSMNSIDSPGRQSEHEHDYERKDDSSCNGATSSQQQQQQPDQQYDRTTTSKSIWRREVTERDGNASDQGQTQTQHQLEMLTPTSSSSVPDESGFIGPAANTTLPVDGPASVVDTNVESTKERHNNKANCYRHQQAVSQPLSMSSSSDSLAPLCSPSSSSTFKTKHGIGASAAACEAGEVIDVERGRHDGNGSTNMTNIQGSDDGPDGIGTKSSTNNGSCRAYLPYCLSWIPWALNLTYLQMMEGIPGTGTRNGGWSGPTLKCNLDGIILLKFHSLCLKVSIVATILCLGIVLPVNYTAPCDPDIHGAVTCQNITQLTDFERTTLAHIPPLESGDRPGSAKEFFSQAFRGDVSTSMRLFAIVACAYVIYTYACSLIWEQWIECLALRRAYYLEYNHYEGRNEELQFLKTLDDIPEDPLQNDRAPFLPHPELRETVPNIGLYSVLYKLPLMNYVTVASATSSQIDRQLSAATEFFDKIAPNQPGYSSSVAALTILPDVRQVSIAWKKWFKCAAKLRRLRFIRKQLQRLREGQNGSVEIFFDHQQINEHSQEQNRSNLSYTNQKSSEYSEVNQLYHDQCEHHQNASRTTTETPPLMNSSNKSRSIDPAGKVLNIAPPRTNTPRGSLPPLETVDEGSSSECFSIDESTGKNTASVKIPRPYLSRSTTAETVKRGTKNRGLPSSINSLQIGITDPATETANSPVEKREYFFQDSLSRASPSRGYAYSLPSDWGGAGSGKEEFLASVGLLEEAKLENFLSEYDIEQLTVYSREFARTSAMCCPYGCDEYAIRRADAATLADMEVEAEEAVREASEELRHARALVNRVDFRVEASEYNGFSRFGQVRRDSQEDLKLNLNIGNAPSPDNHRPSNEEHRTLASGSSNILNSTSIMSSMSRYWEEAEALVQKEYNHSGGGLVRRKRKLSTGEWTLPVFRSGADAVKAAAQRSEQVAGKLASRIVRTDSYAVVTFTSRQAAIAARQCLADGSGLDRWLELEDIPTPSLADAPPWDIFNCRGCCRPVTLTLPQEQKRWRQNFVYLFLALFCFLYTIPLTAASSLVTPADLSRTFPDLVDEERLSGFLTGLLYTAFFSICPQIFKILSNFGSGATSVLHAETSAMHYYWLFMLATAFTGTSLATIIIEGIYYNFNVAEEARDVLRQVASTIPTTVGSTWINWLIIRYSVTLPTNYLLQFPTLAWRAIQFKCCSRMTAGGGPGGPVPYRIYVDSGVAFLCVIGLAPVCPLVAPAALVYFLVATPMFRWLLIFAYRPQFDGGGFRWPHLHNIFITSMLWSQFLLAAMMALKKAWIATCLAAIAIIATYTFSLVVKDRFESCYRDAALLQTSELDGWDNTAETSMIQREKYRRWLVDCHRAAYVPVCVNGDDNFLTAEPAVVIASDHDKPDLREDGASVISVDRYRFDSSGGASGIDDPSPSHGSGGGSVALGIGVGIGGRQRSTTWDSFVTFGSENQFSRNQRGATFRRVGAPSPSFSNSSIPPIPSPSSFAPNRSRTTSGSVMFSDPLEVGSTRSA